MLFGLEGPAQPEAAKIAAAKDRLQQRMEGDPNVPTMQPGSVAVVPPPAFVNGPGGQRISPEELEYRRKVSDQQIAAGMDFSPVQSWTQGLARVAQALVGSQERRKLDRASAANSDARSTIIAELTKSAPSPDAVTAAMADTDPAVREIGGKVFSLQHPKLQGPSDLQQRVEYLNTSHPGLGDTYAQNYAANGGGAPQFITTPRGTFMVPRGPGPTAPEPATAAIPDAAVSYLKANPATASQFDEKFGAGASARYLQGGAAPQAPAPFVTQ